MTVKGELTLLIDKLIFQFPRLNESPDLGRSQRTLIPEYYGPSCLTCHGSPQGEIDITGFPKEGAREGDLGGIISITLYR